MIRSFDFDGTLFLTRIDPEEGVVEVGPNHALVQSLQKAVALGHRVLIVTTRMSRFECDPGRMSVARFLEEQGLPNIPVVFTEGADKVETLIQLGVDEHHDDDIHELALLPPTIKGVLVDEDQ